MIATVARDVEEADFGALSERRKLALATFDWCAVCGLPFGEATRWQVVTDSARDRTGEQLTSGNFFFGEAPVHEVCAVYAAHVCPHLSSPNHRMGDTYRAGQRRSEAIRMAGFRSTSGVVAFESQLQKGVYVLHFAHDGFVGDFRYSGPEDLADRYAELLDEESPPPLTSAETDLVRLFNEHSDAGDTVAGAALMAGASFAKNISEVQGMHVFAQSGYWQGLALHMLDPEKLAEFGEGTKDRATKYMARWLLERQDDLPPVLHAWRQQGLRLARSRGLTIPRPRQAEGPGRTVPRNAPCPCGSGRKARRCHPSGVPSSNR